SFSMTLAPRPRKRIFRPLRSSSDSISSRNQPAPSGGTIAQVIAWMPCSSYISVISSLPPPCFSQARYSPLDGPNGTLLKKLKAVSLPDQNADAVQAMSTDPWDTASKDCSTGTSAFGSLNLMSIEPPDTRATFFVYSTADSPSSGSVLP